VQVSGKDPMLRRFLIGAVACLVLTLVLFTIYKIVLGSGISTLQTVAVEGRR
jgi:hypothetical protein